MLSLKDYQKLHLKKYRDHWGLFIAEGKRICREALQSNWEIVAAFRSDDFQNDPDFETISEQINRKALRLQIINTNQFKKLSDTESPQGILLVLKKPFSFPKTEDIIKNLRMLVLLDGVRDPGNMGTIIRNADWFGIQTIITSPDSVEVYNPKVVRASMGSIFRVNCHESKNIEVTIKQLKKNKISIVGSSPLASLELEDHRPAFPVAIILGGEATGISSNLHPLVDIQVHIKQFGHAESLNVAVASGILMNYYSRLAKN
ncbi:MAG: RNA methyltransferase [bacterium]|nr:MAG: RNA methyltransferase [bacterium]